VSEKFRNKLTIVTLVIAITAASASVLQAWSILPHRVSATEADIHDLKKDARENREILIRIEERVKTLQEKTSRPNL
jgi:hypothetical protein